MARQTSEKLPVVALRGRVVFPSVSVSFDVGRLISLTAVKMAADTDSRLFVVAQKNAEKSDVTPDDIYDVGTVVRIKQITKLPGNNVRISAEGLYRAAVRTVEYVDNTLVADVNELKSITSDQTLEEAYLRTSRDLVRELFSDGNRISKENLQAIEAASDADGFVNITAHNLNVKTDVKQQLLSCNRVVERLRLMDKVLNDELEISRLERKINSMVRASIDKNQKEYYLREQLKAIHTELGDDEEERDELERRIKAKQMPQEVEEKALKELSRMSRMQTSSPDYNVLRMYLDWLLDIPWNEKTEDTESLSDAVKILNEDHYGLDKIKERITEYLAVLKLTNGLNAPILCLVGPPGVGKTSIASSIARSLGRKFVRMSLGGVKDESEIRGHRKTYIGALPGRIIAGLKNAGSANPVFLLDEIDKLSSDMRGDPASALLEVLDPAQNSTFRDRYLEVPYDLSKVLFITTANSVDTIPRPLLDRMELIELGGYTAEIGRAHV